MQFSQRFKQLCKQRGVTQKQALIDMGMHRNAVQSWSACNPSTEALLKMAQYFGITTDEVLGKEQKEKPTPQGGELSYDDMYLLAKFHQADESVKEAIRLLLK